MRIRILRYFITLLIIIHSVNITAQSNLPFSPYELFYIIKQDEIVDEMKEKEQKKGTLSKLDIEDEESINVVEADMDRMDIKDQSKSIIKHEGNEMITYFANGNIKDRCVLKNGMRNGIRKVFYPNGTLQQEVPYINDRINGVARYYHENGMPGIETNYVMGKRQGNRTIYFQKYKEENEKIMSLTPYRDDLIHGVVKKFKTRSDRYYLEYTAEFVKGDPEGKWLTYEEYDKPFAKDKRGMELTVQATYKKQEENNVRGRKNGKDIIYRPDGSVISVTMYKDNKKQYTDMYDSSGKKVYTNKFTDGKRQGLHKFYHDNGKLRSIVPFVNDMRHGKVVRYYSNGVLESTSEFDMDELTGNFIEYTYKGKLKQETKYGSRGKKSGIEKIYFGEGNVRVITEYDSAGMKLSEIHFDRHSQKKYQATIYKNNIQAETHYYSENGELVWKNNLKGRRNVGIYRHYQPFGKLDVQTYIDEKENGYRFRYHEYNGKLIEKKYFLAGKIVPENEFFEMFTIEDDMVKPK